jgi:hypothetical protein
MKFAQFLFRFICLSVAIFQIGLFLKKAILENQNLEVNEIVLSDSDETDSENQEEEMTFFVLSSRPVFDYQDVEIKSNSKKMKIYSHCRKLISESQVVPYSPPELEV